MKTNVQRELVGLLGAIEVILSRLIYFFSFEDLDEKLRADSNRRTAKILHIHLHPPEAPHVTRKPLTRSQV